MTKPHATGATPATAGPDGLYERDFVTWLDRQAMLIRDGQLDRLDLAHLAEELEDMSKSKRQELRSRLDVLLTHLLKYQFQPESRTGSWLGTIIEQRARIEDLFEESPSLRPLLADLLNDERLYRTALRVAVAESGLPKARFPERNPYGPEALDEDFWPGTGPHPDF
ncbi:MAG TPA: DUF29 domain-containing protein [Azospirillum sp.]